MSDFIGLNQKQVEENRKRYGKNTIKEAVPATFWQQFLEGFSDPMIKILCVVAVVMMIMCAFGAAEIFEPIGTIIAVLLVNFVSAKTGVANDNAYAELKAAQEPETAKVIRNGIVTIVDVDDIVVNDIVILQAGDRILADGVLVDGAISVDNSALNGEAEECKKRVSEKKAIPYDVLVDENGYNSFPTKKEMQTVTDENGKQTQKEVDVKIKKDIEGNDVTIVGDSFVDTSSLFRGATVIDGKGYMQVTAVGMTTMSGEMSEDMQDDEVDSPLKVKLGNLANAISKFGYIGGGLIAVVSFVSSLISSTEALSIPYVLTTLMESVSVAITIIVCAVPEGLPLVIALVLMLNTGKLMKHNVQVRKSSGIEAAGSLNILFSDKTGTITKGELEVVEFFTGDGQTVVLDKSNNESAVKANLNLSIGKNTGAMYDDRHNVVGGNMTDKALVKFLGESTFNALAKDHSIEVTESQEFNSANKFSQVYIESEKRTFYKGAPERLVAKAKKYIDIDGTEKEIDANKLNAKIDELANRAMRVLAFGYSKSPLVRDEINDDIVIIGLVGIRDDVRPEAKAAIEEVKGAGIQVVMITGDRRETAVAIAKESGLLGADAKVLTLENKEEIMAEAKKLSSKTNVTEAGIALTSDVLGKLTDDEVKVLVPLIRVIARALPTDKSRMVKICQELNLVCGMTGDGVNDAPALKRADVGFAMGSGTAVAKEAGDLIIIDDNFKSIKDAIWYGRTLYINILKFCKMQLAINVSAVLMACLGPVLGMDEPLKVTHLLWVNLVMDSLASLMMAGEPALEKYMKQKPRRRDESIVSKPMAVQIGIMSVWLTILGLIWFFVPTIKELFADEAQWYTGYFCLFIFAALVNAFNIRSESANVFEHIGLNTAYIKIWLVIAAVQILLASSSLIPVVGEFISKMFACEAFGIQGWLAVILLALTMYPIDVIRKSFVKTDKVEEN